MVSNVQIIRRVITHRTICFYSPNTLFLKVNLHQLIPFIYFQLFYLKTIFFKIHYTIEEKMNCTMRNYTPYNLYMDVPLLTQPRCCFGTAWWAITHKKGNCATFTKKPWHYQSRFAVRKGKKNPNQETGLGNRGPLVTLMIPN